MRRTSLKQTNLMSRFNLFIGPSNPFGATHFRIAESTFSEENFNWNESGIGAEGCEVLIKKK